MKEIKFVLWLCIFGFSMNGFALSPRVNDPAFNCKGKEVYCPDAPAQCFVPKENAPCLQHAAAYLQTLRSDLKIELEKTERAKSDFSAALSTWNTDQNRIKKLKDLVAKERKKLK